MQYRKIGADRVFDGCRMLADHHLVLGPDGSVADLVPTKNVADVRLHSGILMPGLINCHCHLELSHLKNVIPPGSGLVPFLINVVQQRSAPDAVKQQKIREAADEMERNGIVAVADICNTPDAINVKKQSSIYWHSLVEVLNFFDANLQQALDNYSAVASAHQQQKLPAVLTPHAPYSVSAATLEELNRLSAGRVISMHNQETEAEDELFRSGTGAFLRLYDTFLDGRVPVAPTGLSSLQSWLPYFTNGQTILLVHNSFITEEDIRFATAHAARHGLQLVYCICANANLYIESVLPPVELLMQHKVPIVLGTDSYSSNWQLDIMSEIRTIRKYFPAIPLATLLQWATSVGAAALQLSQFGSFAKGKRPGVLLLQEEDLTVQRIA